MWGATIQKTKIILKEKYFNPRSPCGERLVCVVLIILRYIISIHAPRVGSDGLYLRLNHHYLFISIHAPRVGSDVMIFGKFLTYLISIHAPRVGSDVTLTSPLSLTTNFNPRSPCGERPVYPNDVGISYNISIHAPRVGSDATFSCVTSHLLGFQSTLPVWGATRYHWEVCVVLRVISIHAPRVGSDCKTHQQKINNIIIALANFDKRFYL